MLIDEDDFPLHQTPLPLAHVMNGHPNAYDRYWFNGYDENHFFAVALGLYPNRGVIDAAFSIVDGNTQRSVFAGDQLNGRPTSVGPIDIQILEPLRRNRIVVDAPQQGVRADLEFVRRTEPVEEPRQTMNDNERVFMDVTRVTQMGTWHGWIETPDSRLDVEGMMGTKDRSWGVRPVGEPLPGAPSSRKPQLCFHWAQINFDDGAVHYMSFDDESGHAIVRSAHRVALDGQGETSQCTAALSFVPRPGTRQVNEATLILDNDSIVLTPLSTFHMRGAGYSHPQFAHGRWHNGPFVDGEILDLASLDPLEYSNIHVQQMVRATQGDRVGLGVLESLIVGPYAPMGLDSLLDGAK
jgi:hypothetical protein